MTSLDSRGLLPKVDCFIYVLILHDGYNIMWKIFNMKRIEMIGCGENQQMTSLRDTQSSLLLQVVLQFSLQVRSPGVASRLDERRYGRCY